MRALYCYRLLGLSHDRGRASWANRLGTEPEVMLTGAHEFISLIEATGYWGLKRMAPSRGDTVKEILRQDF